MTLKKKIIAVVLVFLFLINIVLLGFIFIDIQVLAFPQTTLRIDIVEINTDEIILQHDLELYNPNSFDMILKDFQIVATTPGGEEVTNLSIPGGSIPGQTQQSFTATDRISMKGNLSDVLSSKVTGVVGLNLFGIIQKTIPLEMTVLTSMKEVLQKITLPTVSVYAEFGTITRYTAELLTEITVTNPNLFGMSVDNFQLTITTETGSTVGQFTIAGSQIPAESTVTLTGNGSVSVQALNAKKLLISLQAEAGAAVAGITKSLPFTSSIEIAIPALSDFIPQDKPLELALDVDLKRVRGGLAGNMTLEVINPTKIPLIVTDLAVEYFGVKNKQKYFVAEGPMGSGELVPESTTYFYGDILLQYSKLLNFSIKGLIPQSVFAQIRASISLYGVNQSIPVALGSYIDFRPLRPSP
jgi:LEA14-like dessication related protein